MILDKMDSFYNTTADTTGYLAANETLGGTTSGTGQIRDLAELDNFGGHRKLYLNIEGAANLTGGTTPTLTVNLCSDSAIGFATAKVTNYTSGVIAAASVAATRIKVLLPDGVKRYSRMEWTLTGTPTGGGTFKAFLSAE
jgi:hypothetical protein